MENKLKLFYKIINNYLSFFPIIILDFEFSRMIKTDSISLKYTIFYFILSYVSFFLKLNL